MIDTVIQSYVILIFFVLYKISGRPELNDFQCYVIKI